VAIGLALLVSFVAGDNKARHDKARMPCDIVYVARADGQGLRRESSELTNVIFVNERRAFYSVDHVLRYLVIPDESIFVVQGGQCASCNDYYNGLNRSSFQNCPHWWGELWPYWPFAQPASAQRPPPETLFPKQSLPTPSPAP
jgi:hypothetical protein